MFPDFLPSLTEKLTESTSIALAKNIDRQEIITPLAETPIATTFIRQGKGNTPILLLHGFDGSIFEFRRLLPLLAQENETWAIDLLGFGFTQRLSGINFNPKAIKTHLYHSWKTLINKPVILVGVSMGGAAAIDFTLTYPELVQNLILIDSVGWTSGPALGKFLVPPLGYLATEFLRSPKVRRNVSIQAYDDKKFVTEDAEICASLHLQMPNWNQALISFTRSGGYTSFREQLININQSTLILWGEKDRILGTADAEKFQEAIVHSKLIWIKDCGHVPHLEKAEIIAKHILNFRD